MAVGPRVFPVVDVAAPNQGIVLAVGGDDLSKGPAPLHQGPHHALALHALSIVAEGDHPGGQGLEVRRLLPALAFGQSGVWVEVDQVPGRPDQPFLFLQVFYAVRHGIQVGHGADRRIPAPGRRHAAGQHGFLIRKPGLSEMHMHVTETGKYSISFFCTGKLPVLPHKHRPHIRVQRHPARSFRYRPDTDKSPAAERAGARNA